MARAAAALALLACLAALRPCGAQELQLLPEDPLQPLLPQLQARTSVGTAWDLLLTLNSSAGSTLSQLITLTDDIYLQPSDVAAFQPWLPLECGSRTVALAGAKPGANQTVLDFGGAVGLLYHPAGQSFIFHGLLLQGMAPAASGSAAGLEAEMVGAYLWPTSLGQPGHLMAYWDTTLLKMKPACSAGHFAFSLQALRLLAGRNDTIYPAGDAGQAIFIGQMLNGSYVLRDLTTGDTTGSVLYSWFNTTLQCVAGQSSPVLGSGMVAPAGIQAPPQTAPTGVAGTPDQLLALLGNPNVTRIVLGVHLSLGEATLAEATFPIVLSNRSLDIASMDGQVKVLDLGQMPRVLFLSSGSQLSIRGVHLQGLWPQSQEVPPTATAIKASPLWPAIDGARDHSVLLVDSAVHAAVSPCSRDDTALWVEQLRKTIGDDEVQPVGLTGLAILPRSPSQIPITDAVTGLQVGNATFSVQNVVFECEEDTSTASQPTDGLSAAAAPAGLLSSSSTHPPWAVIASALGGAAGAALVAACSLLLCRRRRAAQQAAAGAAAKAVEESSKATGSGSPDGGGSEQDLELVPLTPRSARLARMESATLPAEETHSFAGTAAERSLSDPSQPGSGSTKPKRLQRTDSLEPESWRPWHSWFGVIGGLEVAELLGRGAYGRVYKGRWNGVVVAVKVVEHCVSCGEPSSLSREPLLCMSVSHPNCISTYKLSVIRLLRGHDLLPSEDSEELAGPAANPVRLSISTDDTAMHGGDSPSVRGRQRLLRSLLSGAEAVEVEDPSGPLQPGLYEIWIVSEFCERGPLGDAIAEKPLLLPDGRPHMVSIYLCLLDIAAGMQYLHSMGIMHSDLKPANVVLKGTRNSMRGFSCKLADFGLSRMLVGRATHVETGSYGTPTHAAPELLREGRLSPAVDVFAFGVLGGFMQSSVACETVASTQAE